MSSNRLLGVVFGDERREPGDVFGCAVVCAAVAVGHVRDLLGFEEGGQQAAVVGADAELVEGFAEQAVAESGVDPAGRRPPQVCDWCTGALVAWTAEHDTTAAPVLPGLLDRLRAQLRDRQADLPE